MAYRYDDDRPALVVDSVKDAIVPDPKAITVRLTRQLCSPTRARVLCQDIDMRSAPRAGLNHQFAKLPRRGG